MQHGLAGANGYSGLTKTSTSLARLSSKRTIL
ncbi:AzlC family protein [Neisseria meningitidis]|nr:AzlC family protein [Neisseria meningitidis]MBG8584988.1 AzlC family protein [Neisseria meningitidis]MBG8587978.1 AzlC family protein [Neisseria meningitidis]MBG8607018.1 AzlC family protein [Neisseria meningitidis]MBG8612163.1 AzlC family protein [Neisseria meningitidis]